MHNDEWAPDEVYQTMGDTKLDNIEGVGPVRTRLFSAAGFVRIHDVRDLPDEEAVRARLEKAVCSLEADPVTRQRTVNLCMGVIAKLFNPDAAPFVPEHLACPITYEVMAHPVVTSTGQTYEKQAIKEHIENKMTAGSQPVDHNNTPIYPLGTASPNKSSSYYVTNYAVKHAIGYYMRHSMRFNILLKSAFRH